EGDHYDVVYRNKTRKQNEYHLIHAQGSRLDINGAPDLFLVWYLDESKGINNQDPKLRENMIRQLNNNIEVGAMVRRNRYDDLTGLPNMSFFVQLASESKKERITEGEEPVILFMDLSNMKLFNHRYGFAAGDKLIRGLGSLLADIFGTANSCRFSEDHFAVFAVEQNLEAKLEKLFSDLKQINGGNTLPLRVGIYRDSFENVSISTACDRAKIACDTERGLFSSKYVYFDKDMYDKTEQKEYVLSHFEQALSEHWIQAWFQPIADSASGDITDEEALARWIDPDQGMLRPDLFIPVLEDAGLLYKLDLYMIDQIIDAIRRKREAGIKPLPVSVNLSQLDFKNCDMKKEINRRLAAAGIDKKYITIEITERSIGEDPELLKMIIDEFRSDGYSVWLDDFGSEYSSLNIVNNYHFNLVKLDMKFIQRFNTSTVSRLIVEEVIDFSKKAGIETVAEGVETEEQAEFLRDCGCTKLQGFLYSRPLPLNELIELYQR
ncbi:MAG: EAL domain-containing protein, partial [Eubacterium sp.]